MDWMLSDEEIAACEWDEKGWPHTGRPGFPLTVAFKQHRKDVEWLNGPCPHMSSGVSASLFRLLCRVLPRGLTWTPLRSSPEIIA